MAGDESETLPQGTLRLERLLEAKHGEIILHPTPSADPNDPLNWPAWYKIMNFSLSLLYVLMVYVNIDIQTVIWSNLNTDLGISFRICTISFGVNLAALAFGCVFFIPFALKFGRRPVYLFSIAGSIASTIWQARMMTSGDLIGTNVLSGLAGAIAETICQMTIADIFFVHHRATANGAFIFVSNVGTFLGPVAAGYSAASQGWRWIFWWTTIIAGVSLILFIFLYEETTFLPQPAAVLPAEETTRKPSDLRRESKPEDGEKTVEPGIAALITSITEINIRRKTYYDRLTQWTSAPGDWKLFLRHIYQPFIIVFTFPAVAYTAITYAALLCWFSVIVNVYSIYFTLPPYNFGPSGIGLMNLPPFIGTIIGCIYSGFTADWLAVRLSRRNNGIFEPEMRLWVAMPCVVLMPAAIIMFGISTAEGLPWIVPCVGCALFGFCFAVLGDISLTYMMDCYKDIIGDALVAVCFARNAFSAVVAMTLTDWIDGVGLINLFIMCTVIAFVLAALAIPMMIWGKRMRILTGDRFERMAKKQFDVRD